MGKGVSEGMEEILPVVITFQQRGFYFVYLCLIPVQHLLQNMLKYFGELLA